MKEKDKEIRELREQLKSIETAIKRMVRVDMNRLDRLHSDEKNEILSLLKLRQRLLNQMMQPTPEEVRRLEHQNERLYRLSQRMHRLDDAWWQFLYEHQNGEVTDKLRDEESFREHCNIEGTIVYDFYDEKSVIRLPEDGYYGSDFTYMLKLISWLLPDIHTCSDKINFGVPPRSHSCDDGQTWAEDVLMQPAFDHICICYALHAACFHMYYSVPDVLRMGNFVLELNTDCDRDYEAKYEGQEHWNETQTRDKAMKLLSVKREREEESDNPEPLDWQKVLDHLVRTAGKSYSDITPEEKAYDEQLHLRIRVCEDMNALRNIVVGIEQKLKQIAGDPADEESFPDWKEEELEVISDLMSWRGYLLNNLMQPMPEEIHLLEQQNDLLRAAGKEINADISSLHRLWEDFKATLGTEKFDFEDISGALLHQADEIGYEVMKLPHDCYYGSDFNYALSLAHVLEWRSNNQTDELDTYQLGYSPDEDYDEWTEGWLRQTAFSHIKTCHAVHSICTHHSFYSVPDLLHMQLFTRRIYLNGTIYDTGT